MPATATAPARSPRTRVRHTSGRNGGRAPLRPTGSAIAASSRLVPVAVGRTAVAVGGLADSGLIFRLTRGRLWIGLLATLLVGIVGLNVVALSFSARSSETARKAETLEQRNSALRAQLASQLSNDELQAAAAKLGLLSPAPGAIRYLKPGPDDAAIAAERLRSGELTTDDAAAVTPAVTETVDPAVTETATPDTSTTEPTDTVVVDPAAADAAATDEAASETPTADPAASEAVDAAALGGVAAP
jgi:hypothetical protein